MDWYKQALDRIRQMLGALNGSQRMALLAGAAVLFSLLVWYSTSASGDGGMVRVVGHEVSDADRGRVLKQLQEKNQQHEVRNREIYVPKADADRVFLELNSNGVLSTEVYWDFLKTSDPFVGRWQNEKRHQLALQGKLEHMIRTMDGVESAEVILNPADARQAIFAGGQKGSAAVRIKLRPGKEFSPQNTFAVAGLVARAVTGLQPEAVHIADTEGRFYAVQPASMGSAAGLLDLKRQQEQNYERKIEAMYRGSKAAVNLTLRSKNTTSESEKHQNPQPVREQTDQRKIKGQEGSAPVGIKGEGELGSPSGGGSTGGRDETQTSSSVENKLDRVKVLETQEQGEIEKITATVSIPVEAAADGKMDPALLARVAEIRKGVMNILGMQASEDGVSIFPVPIPTRKPDLVAAPGLLDRVADFVGAWGGPLLAVLLVPLALWAIFKVARAVAPMGLVEEIEGLKDRIDSQESPAEPFVLAGAPGESSKLQAGIREMVAKNPSGGGIILGRWMSGR